jgi:hypothetical protein
MLDAIFEVYIVSMYESYDVANSNFKYIHCDLIDVLRYLTITLIFDLAFVTTFFPQLNVGLYIRVTNFGVTFWNKFEKGDWGFVLKVGGITLIKLIDPFPTSLCVVVIISSKVSYKGQIGTTWNLRDGCHMDIWQVCQNLYFGYGRWVRSKWHKFFFLP